MVIDQHAANKRPLWQDSLTKQALCNENAANCDATPLCHDDSWRVRPSGAIMAAAAISISHNGTFGTFWQLTLSGSWFGHLAKANWRESVFASVESNPRPNPISPSKHTRFRSERYRGYLIFDMHRTIFFLWVAIIFANDANQRRPCPVHSTFWVALEKKVALRTTTQPNARTAAIREQQYLKRMQFLPSCGSRTPLTLVIAQLVLRPTIWSGLDDLGLTLCEPLESGSLRLKKRG